MQKKGDLVSFQDISLPLTLMLLAIGGIILVLIGKDFPLSNWANLVQAWPQFTQGWQAHNIALQIPFWLRLLQGIFLILAWVTLLFIAYTTLFSVIFSNEKYTVEDDLESILGQENAFKREHFVGKEHTNGMDKI